MFNREEQISLYQLGVIDLLIRSHIDDHNINLLQDPRVTISSRLASNIRTGINVGRLRYSLISKFGINMYGEDFINKLDEMAAGKENYYIRANFSTTTERTTIPGNPIYLNIHFNIDPTDFSIKNIDDTFVIAKTTGIVVLDNSMIMQIRR